MLQDLKQELPESIAVWAVDTACVVPMRLLGKSYEKAWAYRSATQKLARERIQQMPYKNSQTDFQTLGVPADKVSPGNPVLLPRSHTHGFDPIQAAVMCKFHLIQLA